MFFSFPFLVQGFGIKQNMDMTASCSEPPDVRELTWVQSVFSVTVLVGVMNRAVPHATDLIVSFLEGYWL